MHSNNPTFSPIPLARVKPEAPGSNWHPCHCYSFHIPTPVNYRRQLNTKSDIMRRIWQKLTHKGNRSQKSASICTESPGNVHHADTSKAGPQDLWQAAYDQLDENQQRILSANQPPVQPNMRNRSKTLDMVDTVIRVSEEQYKKYQIGGLKIRLGPGEKHINLRDIAQKTLTAAFSFKDVFSAISQCDPTGHASSAWAVISLGLTVCKCKSFTISNH